ncbi:MAG: hypothetical protein H6703_10330 [Myxococcales bacterium]|nr:hypothetical protein [Myxococcales bacterium]
MAQVEAARAAERARIAAAARPDADDEDLPYPELADEVAPPPPPPVPSPPAAPARRSPTPLPARFAADLLAAVHLLGVVLTRGDWRLGLPLFAIGALWTAVAAILHARRRPGALVPLGSVVGLVWWLYAAQAGALVGVAGLDAERAQAAAGMLAVLHLVAPFVVRRRPFE